GSTPAPAGSAAPSAAAGDGIVVVAKDIAFATASIKAPAGEGFQILLDNQDSAPHNIAIKDASGAVVYKGEIVTSAKVTNNVQALAAGTYQFFCEVHPNMTGTLTAE
ncbi:MAG TPA: cupredoxin domain-containing protein, partial [Methylomirabilota bacterium]|nr:cupredoxin domain-containing protein [Methylomirabilota bacterium]